MKCVVPNTLFYTEESTKMPLPDAADIRCGENVLGEGSGQVFSFVSFGQNGAQCFTFVLHSIVFSGK